MTIHSNRAVFPTLTFMSDGSRTNLTESIGLLAIFFGLGAADFETDEELERLLAMSNSIERPTEAESLDEIEEFDNRCGASEARLLVIMED